MKNFLQTYKDHVLISAIGLCIVAFLFIIAFFLLRDQQPTTSLPQNSTDISSASALSPYLKSRIGEKKENLEKDPNFKQKIQLNSTTNKYDFFSPNLLNDNVIITNNGTVIYEKSVTVDTNYMHPTIDSYKKAYGNPERTIKGSKKYGGFETYYIYASRGFTLVGNPFTKEIDEIQTYKPMSVEDYIQTWGEDIDRNQTSKEAIDQ